MKTSIKSYRKALTLVELMISMGIFTILSAMILTLMITINRSLLDSENKATIDKNFRSTTSAIAKIVSCADQLYVFNKQVDNSNGLVDEQTPLGGNGDYLVAVYYANPGRVLANGTLDRTVSRIAGFCRLPKPLKEQVRDDVSLSFYMFDSAVNNWGKPLPANHRVLTDITAALPSQAQIYQCTRLAESVFAPESTAYIGKGIFHDIGGKGALMMARVRTGKISGRFVSNGYTFSVSSRNL